VKTALISDIHANFAALQAVLRDIRAQRITTIHCLGDIVGYGPNPCECLDKVIESCEVTILGNHDQATLFDPDGFNPVALQAVYWTREQLESGSGSAAMVSRRWDFLGELPRTHNEDKLLYVHGSPREPTNEYVFPEDVYNQRKMDALFARIDQYCFAGHTHIPGVFTFDREFLAPEDIDFQFRLGSEQVMINVGSVGQPRDNDPRACYCILDEDVVMFRRVEYDVEATVHQIYATPDLDNMLGDRLRSGR
jgi:predicted phosphodiesterase